ncbi:MAG: sugar transferase [Vulcanimicrobiaceae bacterium]
MHVVESEVHPLITASYSRPRGRRAVPPSWWVMKRATDLVVGTLLLIVTLPILLVAAIAIVIFEGGSPFFAQERVGRDGRTFRLWKLRTMVDGAHEMRDDIAHLNELDGPVFKIKNDPRVHPLGVFLRRTSIDELPNLLNVVKGEIALVGPRPALPEEVADYDADALRRLAVPQGITCLWQINGRCRIGFDEWMRLDAAYVDSWTPFGDLKILLATIPAVLRKDGAH